MTSIVYLACPYTHSSMFLRETRWQLATRAAVYLARKGLVVYSPITMTHPMDVLMNENGGTLGSDYWVKFDEAFMEHCREMYVLCAWGWERSSGINRERNFFEARERPIHFITLDELLT